MAAGDHRLFAHQPRRYFVAALSWGITTHSVARCHTRSLLNLALLGEKVHSPAT
jgi:hypothetical protein